MLPASEVTHTGARIHAILATSWARYLLLAEGHLL